MKAYFPQDIPEGEKSRPRISLADKQLSLDNNFLLLSLAISVLDNRNILR